jgi:hypothetical protein
MGRGIWKVGDGVGGLTRGRTCLPRNENRAVRFRKPPLAGLSLFLVHLAEGPIPSLCKHLDTGRAFRTLQRAEELDRIKDYSFCRHPFGYRNAFNDFLEEP